MNLSEVRHALAQARVRPVKTLGQNFLHDQNLARWIVDQARIEAGDFVVEIGPGLGALTAETLRRGAKVLAIEKDKRLVDFLDQHFPQSSCQVRHGDALQFDVRELFGERNVKIIGNLPYYIASALLGCFLKHPTPITLALFTLQDEMARRLSASPATGDYGAFTVRVQRHFRVEYLRKFPGSVFFPQPDVASALVRITPRHESELGICRDDLFQKIVRQGFSQRRKQLRKLLDEPSEKWERAARKIGASSTARAEELSLKQWIALASLLGAEDDQFASAAQEERFPVVDAHDQKIGNATRVEVHGNNLRHRAVHILLFNAAGEILLQKRSPLKDRHPLVWDSSAAGHVENDESYAETAARELKEELGVEATLELIEKIPASEKTGEEFISVYHARHEGPFRFPADEITAVKFFPVKIVERWITNKPEDFAPGFLECWKLLSRAKRSGE